MDSLLDRASAFMLNMNGRDRGPDYIGQPELLEGEQNPLTPLYPFNGKAPSMIDVDVTTVPPLSGVAPMGNVLPVQNIESDLRQLRAEMPFLPIIKRPQRALSLLLAANVAQNVNVLTSDALFRFLAAPGAVFFVNFAGAAAVPVVGNPDTGSLYAPLGVWYYAGSVQQISVIAAANDTIVTLEFIGRVSQP